MRLLLGRPLRSADSD